MTLFGTLAECPPSGTVNDGDRKEVLYQNVVVMRHGDRLDNFDHMWVSQAEYPWDPPLTTEGLQRAFSTGRKLRRDLGFSINRVFVSPFLRCVQTASQVISSLCSVEDNPAMGSSIDPSNKIKVSIELGLCEMMNHIAIPIIPKDQNWGFDISVLESILPPGTLDSTADKIFKALPNWEEKFTGARMRYKDVIQALSTKYHSENLLLVTHGEAVGASVSSFDRGITVSDVQYCAYSHLRRTVADGGDGAFVFGDFEVVTESGSTGINYIKLE